MGEAARRKAKDALYGREPKGGRGIIISPPIEIDGDSIEIVTTSIDEQELRFSVLFFDRLMWPSNNVLLISGGSSTVFLEQCGILTRPRYPITGEREVTSAFIDFHLRAFEDVQAKEPGLWSLSKAYSNVLKHSPSFVSSGGSYAELLGAIPVPDKDVPLNDILEFKEKRRDELLGLRIEIQDFASTVQKAGDDAGAFVSALEKIEKGCLDVLAVTQETGFPFRLSNVTPRFDVDILKIVGGFITSAGVLAATSMPSLSLALLGHAIRKNVSLKVGGDISRKVKGQTSPFQYVASFHKEVFNAG
ncbi:hypothetical protein GHK38_03415 [Sinorhizobium meliloti]|uniref:DUF6236 family protein n=1 Tax=Rhizobium meliloti TaxID=382 RepID=UPI000B496DE6|nr:DUF6236 family protein [Sinorhizobium meliloti]ASQ03685.1 hypothetical protein CDO23_06780 [Sinorhizobium meliloti]MQV38681.1 hypothetical protein [Sinorhizobium meliloti]